MRYKSPPHIPDPMDDFKERVARQFELRQCEIEGASSASERYSRDVENVLKRRAENNEAASTHEEVANRVDDYLFPRNPAFSLGWMQSPVTQSQKELWDSIFTVDTKEEQKQLVMQHNTHLNEPVRQGEIILLPTREPEKEQEKSLIEEWKEEAVIASKELVNLLDEELTVLIDNLELLSYELARMTKENLFPENLYAQTALGVGSIAVGVEAKFRNIKKILEDINELYIRHSVVAQSTGSMKSDSFVAERAVLFKKLDKAWAGVSSSKVNMPIHKQVKRSLKLSTKSVIHNADHAMNQYASKEIGRRIGNSALWISGAQKVGYIGLAIGAKEGLDKIHDACVVSESGECAKTTAIEVSGFLGSAWLGAKAGGAAIVLAIGLSASAPVVIGVAVVGAAVGGASGGAVAKMVAEKIYDFTEEIIEGE